MANDIGRDNGQGGMTMAISHGTSLVLGCHQTVQEAIQLFSEHGIAAVDVVDEHGRSVGRCTWRMLLRAIAKEMDRMALIGDVLAAFSMDGKAKVERGKKWSRGRSMRRVRMRTGRLSV